MNKNIFILLIATVMITSSMTLAVGFGDVKSQASVDQYTGLTPTKPFIGNVTIYANGSVSSATEISQNGNQYGLNNNLNGTLIDLRNNSVVSGNGFIINAMGGNGFNITHTSSVKFSDFNVTNSTKGGYVLYSTNVTVVNSNLTASYYGLYAMDSAFVSILQDKLTSSSDLGIYSFNTPEIFVNATDIHAPTGFESATSISLAEFNNDTIITSYVGLCFAGDLNRNIVVANVTVTGVELTYGIEITSCTSYDVKIVGNEFKNAVTHGIYVDSKTGYGYTINNNLFVNDYGPIYLSDLYNTVVDGNHFNKSAATYVIEGCYLVNVNMSGNSMTNFSSATGIYLDYSNNVSIKGNTIYNTSYGVDLCESTGITVDSNSISKASYGVYLASCVADNINVSGNIISGITSNGIELSVESGANYTVNNNVILNSSYPIGVYYDVQHVNIDGNRIINSSGYAVNAEYASTISVSGNLISGFRGVPTSQYGIYVEYSNQAVISDNAISGNLSAIGARGIYILATSPNSVFGNKVINTTYGIYVEYSGMFSVFNNTIENSSYGLYSYTNAQFSYYSNLISNSTSSLESQGDYGGLVYGNTFSVAKLDMVFLSSSSSLTFYHNNFLNGSSIMTYIHASSQLVWNMSLPVAGNYWSSYTGTGTSGIGSTPYVVNGTTKDFLPLTARWTGYTITFVESGLPAGTAWTVTLGNSSSTSSTQTVVFSPEAAQYVTRDYSVTKVSGYTASPSVGSVALDQTNKVITLTFTPVTYPVSFTEAGLPLGTTWSVMVGSQKGSSSTATVSFSLSNGTYNYTVEAVTGYHSTLQTGTLVVSSAGKNVSLSFVQNKYTLIVSETGLPAGKAWTVNVSGTTKTSTNTSIDIELVSGNYTVSVSSSPSYNVTLSARSVTINNANATVGVVFRNTTSPPNAANAGAIYEGLGTGVVIGALAGILGTMIYSGTWVFRKYRKGKGGTQ